ncbi:recombination repair protein 1-like [Camellia sinensis]|uniref:recombination repair protein 1-like n=1 Tax=Camellia sinensis TaxID=4442 RepID=UPI001035FD66|nr:recombination repair protein 1-like [Camellia sinensis]
MAQEEVVNVRVDPLGDDDAEELAARYRTETRMVGVGEPVGQSQAVALILTPRPISQVEPDQWHMKADKSTITTADLEAIREKYQIPAEARKEGKALKKKKKKKRSAPEGAADESGAKRAKVAPTEVEAPVAKDTPEVVGVTPTLEAVETAPTIQELEEERVKAEEENGRLVRELETEKAKAMAKMESLRKGVEEERATAVAERGALQRELGEERAKAASERAAYPDLCVAAVEQYKGSSEFQMAVDAAVARSLAGQESGGSGWGKDLSSFEPRPPPVDPVKEQARKEGEALKKKKKKKRSAPEGAADEFGAKRAKVAPTEVEAPVAKDTPEVVGVTPALEAVETAPTVQVGVGMTEAEPSGRE